jgi:hypothetical protein
MYCLAVVKNSEKSEAFEAPIISSKWITTKCDTVHANVRFATPKAMLLIILLMMKSDKAFILLQQPAAIKCSPCLIEYK